MQTQVFLVSSFFVSPPKKAVKNYYRRDERDCIALSDESFHFRM
jgi:hypothetical protein